MREDLIERLREDKSWIEQGTTETEHEIAEHIQQAADAIEDLEFACNRYEKDYKALCEYLPKWIPVTERLPEQKINQNTLDFEYVLCATTFGDVRPYKFGRRIGQGEPHFWNGAGYVDAYVTHWQPLPEPPKEET